MKSPDARFARFISSIWSYHGEHRRDMPWRDDTRPYYVVVSEIMLQQTQVYRVLGTFDSFIRKFPDWKSLARASTREVLREWSGLGYNRRALYLKRIAEIVAHNPHYSFMTDTKSFHMSPDGTPQAISSKKLPRTKGIILQNNSRSLKETYEDSDVSVYELLRALPGIGPNTAGSILAFAYNIPHPFIETNIRSVFIHFFFAEIEKHEGKKACKKIDDVEIFPFIEQALAYPKNKKNPREWHYALMDYGSDLKKRLPNPSRRSAHHLKQKPFKGSNRELRSKILQLIMKQRLSSVKIAAHFKGYPPSHVTRNIKNLTSEGFVTQKNNLYSIA